MTWLIGMKLRVIAGSTDWFSSQVAFDASCHMLATLLSGYIALLGGAGAAGGVDQQGQRVGRRPEVSPAVRRPVQRPRSRTSASGSTTT